jgi:hypothetical protein
MLQFPCLAKPLVADTSAIAERRPTQTQIDKIFSDEEYKFDRVITSPQSPWDRFWEWLAHLIGDLFDNKTGSIVIEIFQYLVIIAAVIIIVILVTKKNARSLFYGEGKKTDLNFKELEENISTTDFEKLIREAVEKKDYRKAIRLYFLKTLKHLSEKELINWKPDKTNFDYYLELSDPSKRNDFKQLSFLYEHVWYGDFSINEEEYKNTANHFHQFAERV